MGRSSNINCEGACGYKEHYFVCACGRRISGRNEKLFNKLEKLHTSKCEEYQKFIQSNNPDFRYTEGHTVFDTSKHQTTVKKVIN